jgi:hypothetical protein
MNPNNSIQLIFEKMLKIYNGEKTASSINLLG